MKCAKKIILSYFIGVVSLFAFDYAYTTFVLSSVAEDCSRTEKNYRIRHETYHHGMSPQYVGKACWGGTNYDYVTNSLGFRDREPQQVPKRSNARRVVFIGDSFTKGVGLVWSDTFVGMIADQRPDLDILNAGVSSYAPSIYFRKVEWMLQHGIEFDDLWVFIDISDIQDEATYYNKDEFGYEIQKVLADTLAEKAVNDMHSLESSWSAGMMVHHLQQFWCDNFKITYRAVRTSLRWLVSRDILDGKALDAHRTLFLSPRAIYLDGQTRRHRVRSFGSGTKHQESNLLYGPSVLHHEGAWHQA